METKEINNSTIDCKITDKKLLPKYETDGSIGMDLKSSEDVVIPAHSRKKVSTGFSIDLSSFSIPLPPYMKLMADVRSRSGLAYKYGLFVLNSPGTIDEDYRGEIQVILHNTSDHDYQIYTGDRIAQLVISVGLQIGKLILTNELSRTVRGEEGFGHTGK